MEACSLCGYVCIRRVELFCCSLAACRTCAVSKLVSTPTCWNQKCGKPANTFHLVAANSSSKDNTLNLVPVFPDNQHKMDKTSNPEANTGFVFGGFLKTVIPSKDSNVNSSALSAEPSSSSQENSLKLRSPIKGHSLPSLKEKLQEHNKKSEPAKRCGPTKKSELTSSLTKTRQVTDPDATFTEAAIPNPLGISSEALPLETSQWNPERLNCDVCKAICKRAVLVPCCKLQACNGCAVLRVIRDGKCWGCSEALRSKDLVNHKYLRIAVEMFKKNGKIDTNIQTTLAQKETCENKDAVSSKKIQVGQEMVSEPLSEDIKSEHDQLAPVVKPRDTISKETNNFAFESIAISETSKIAEATDEQRRPIPVQSLMEENLKTCDAVKPKHLKTCDSVRTPDAVKPKHIITPDTDKPKHLKTPDAGKPKKFSFGWTQTMKKTPFGSPFLKKHGMYSKGTNSYGEGSRINDKCKSAKQSIEVSRKVILTSPPLNIIERNIITGDRDEDIFSSESSISRVTTRRDSGSSCLSKYGSSVPGSAEESASGAFSGTSRKSNTRGKVSRNSSVSIGRKSKSPSIDNGRKSNSTRKINSSSNDKSRRRSPIKKGNRSPRSTSTGIDRRWRSRSLSIQYGRSKSPGIGCSRRSRSPSIQYGRSKSPGIGCSSRSRSPSNGRNKNPGIGRGRRSRSPRKSRSPGIGHGRIRSRGTGHGISRSPSVLYARRNRSLSNGHRRTQYGRSRSPSIGHGRSRSPSVHYARKSKSPGIGHGRIRSRGTGHGRSRSPSVRYARRSRSSSIVRRRSRSPSIQHGRSRSPSVRYARRSRSPSIQYGRRSRSPSIGHGRSRSPVRYARRSRSSSIGRGSRSTSSSISFGNRNSSPSINIGSRSRCNLWKGSQGPSIHPQRRSRSPSFITAHRSSGQSGELGRRSRSPSIKRNSKKSNSNDSSNSRPRIRTSSLETLKIRRKSLDRSSSESWTEVQLGRNLNFHHDHKRFNNECLINRNPSLVASYSSEEEAKNPQKHVETEIDYWEKIKRLKTDQERLWLAKNEFENPVCSDPRTNLTYHGYKRKKASVLECEDVDSFYEFFTNPDEVRLKEVKSERRQKFYIKEGKVLPMPGYIQKSEMRHVNNDDVSIEGASREIINANELKMLLEKEFYQKFETTSQNITSSAHKRYKKALVAHFKAGHEESMEFLKFYKSEFSRGQVEEVIYLEKMYKSFSLHYGKMQPLYCKTCKFAHAF